MKRGARIVKKRAHGGKNAGPRASYRLPIRAKNNSQVLPCCSAGDGAALSKSRVRCRLFKRHAPPDKFFRENITTKFPKRKWHDIIRIEFSNFIEQTQHIIPTG